MQTVHLTISRDYVSQWGVWEAAREIVQNAFDTKDYSIDYDLDLGVMTVCSKGGSLDKKTLILGNSTKRDDDSSIGTYGEGFKLALLVLLREGKNVTIKNGSSLWTPHFDSHPTLENECLALTIEENVIQDNDSTVEFIIEGLTGEEIEEIQHKTLYNFDKRYVEASHNESFCWRPDGTPELYVGGLFVCNLNDKYALSYNFTPDILHLDRDRKSVCTFSLSLEATKMIAISGNYDLLAELAEAEAEDVSDYYNVEYSHGYSSGSAGPKDELKKVLSESFIKKHGEKAYPINANWGEKEKRVQTVKSIEAGFIPVVVKQGYYEMLNTAVKEKDIKKFESFNLMNELFQYYEENKSQLRGKPRRALEQLIEKVELYEGKRELPESVKKHIVIDNYDKDIPF